ncbi:MOP flippase family protein [Tamlana haliotis]|uniref:MOP flippase family protein n=1 Tax=Pseudotamlana haliotis TaxID=2614804 RepID=A0A6N6MES6_9FLAO|nr:MOP flippase family protein [Tamlana haliotis]KAB1067861.1 MOP flippase family protein [Tamlana haliotis]
MKNIKQKTITGTKWTTLSTIIIALTSLVKLSILTRYLEKEDFGLMAIVTVVLGFINLFMDMGITTAILHVQNITKKEYASLYWLNFCFSIILLLFIITISSPVSVFYEETELKTLLNLMSLGLIFSALGRQFKTIELKHLNFKLISIIDIVSAIIALVLAIILALKGFGVYTLVYSALTQFLCSNLIYLFVGIKKNELILHFKFTETKRFLKIGAFQVSGQIINYFNKDLDTLLIGKLLGTEILGGYSLAKQLVLRPTSLINPVLTKVATPSLAIYQNDNQILRRNYLKLLNFVSTLNFSAYLILALLAHVIVTVLYGEAFKYISPLVQILCIYMYLKSINNPIGCLIIATGRTKLEFYWHLLSLVVFPIFIYIGSYYGIYGVASSQSIFMIITLYPFWKILINKMINVKFSEYLYSLIPNYRLKAIKNYLKGKK